MLKLLASELDYELWHSSHTTSYKYILFKKMSQFKQEMCRSMVLGKCFTKYLSKRSMDGAKAKMHALKFVSKKFKAP